MPVVVASGSHGPPDSGTEIRYICRFLLTLYWQIHIIFIIQIAHWQADACPRDQSHSSSAVLRNGGLMTAQSAKRGDSRPPLSYTLGYAAGHPSRAAGTAADASPLQAQIELIAPRSATVLIEGETGAGKEVAARQIHNLSPRASNPFVPVDCTVFSTELMESQLFGPRYRAKKS